jgi:hypothetical protein
MKCACVLLVLLGLADNGHAQRAIHPYVGGSFSFFGNSVLPGWGLEGGVKFKRFYVGLEYGFYGQNIHTESRVEGAIAYPEFEKFLGLHGGIISADSFLWVGPVLLYSEEHRDDGTVLYHFDFGPDLRLFDKKHLAVGIAYTRRRGINPSLNAVF